MKLKQMVSYRMEMQSGWLTASAFFAGMGIFAIALYHFVLTDVSALGTGGLTMQVVLPMAWFAVYVVLLKGVQLKAPLVYGVMGAIYCLLMVVWGFQTPTIMGGVFGAVFFVLAGIALVATTMGLIPGKYYLATALGAVVLLQIFWNDLAEHVITLRFKDYLPMLSKISGVAALSFLCFGLKARPAKK